MRILFVSNYFPGELGALAEDLAARPEHDVLFASNRQRKGFALERVRRVRLKNHPALFGDSLHTAPDLWSEALRRGASGALSFQALRESWGEPDMVLAGIANGAAFFCPSVFPRAFHAAYAEAGPRAFHLLPQGVRHAWALVQSELFLQSQLCFARDERQRSLFPARLHGGIQIFPPCVDTAFFSPAAAQQCAAPDDAPDDAPGAAPDDALIGMDARGLARPELAEFMALAERLPKALASRRGNCRIAIICDNAASAREVESACAASPALRGRCIVCAPAQTAEYRNFLAACALLLRPVQSWNDPVPLLEAMSCETVLLARAAQADFLLPGENMLELPHGACAIAEAAAKAMCGDGAAQRLRRLARMARRTVMERFSRQSVIPAHASLLLRACAGWKQGLTP